MKWCEDCFHWCPSTVEVRDGRPQVGECRRNAPVGVSLLGDAVAATTTELIAHWPMTLPHHWCGEWSSGEQAA